MPHSGALPEVPPGSPSPGTVPVSPLPADSPLAPRPPPAADGAADDDDEADESLVLGEEGFTPLSEWGAADLSRFVSRLGTDALYQRAASLVFHYGLDGLTLMVT